MKLVTSVKSTTKLYQFVIACHSFKAGNLITDEFSLLIQQYDIKENPYSIEIRRRDGPAGIVDCFSIYPAGIGGVLLNASIIPNFSKEACVSDPEGQAQILYEFLFDHFCQK